LIQVIKELKYSKKKSRDIGFPNEWYEFDDTVVTKLVLTKLKQLLNKWNTNMKKANPSIKQI
jgi:signal recognition particle subunit SEC65